VTRHGTRPDGSGHRPLRIAVAGFQHETNTFAPLGAGFADFERADAWPGLTLGQDIISGFGAMNLPIAGFVHAAVLAGAELVPLLWCSAEPSAHVTEDAYERIGAMICDGLAAARGLDGVYLDLHGAMVTEHLDDGEGELLRRVRAVVGAGIPLVASLDLHANVSPAMVEQADALTVFRTYPHLDMAETGARAFPLLCRVLDGRLGGKAMRQGPFLVPLCDQYTRAQPCRTLYARLPALEDSGVTSVDLALGFPPADIADTGPAVVTYGARQEVAEQAADALLADLLDAEPRFASTLLAPEEAVRRALAAPPGRPVVLADVQDNPGAGATSDTVGLLEALIAGGARDAALALLHDPAAAAAAHSAGRGTELELGLGAGSGLPGHEPLRARVRVEGLGDGRFAFTGSMYAGAHAALGPMAALRILDGASGVRVVVGSHRCQCLDRAIFRHVGIEPERTRILAVKSTVHFRADFEAIASEVLQVEAPGANPCRVETIAYRKLRPGVRLGPGGAPFRAARTVHHRQEAASP
jgi:microcystin degradation protein MlrC